MVSVRWKWYVPLVVGRFTARASPEPPMHMRQGLCEKHDGTTNEATATDVSLRMDGQGGDCRLGDLPEILRFQELRDICCNDGRRRLPDLLIRNGERRACSDSQDEVHARVPLRVHRELFSCRWPRSAQPGCMPMPDLPHDGAGL